MREASVALTDSSELVRSQRAYRPQPTAAVIAMQRQFWRLSRKRP